MLRQLEGLNLIQVADSKHSSCQTPGGLEQQVEKDAVVEASTFDRISHTSKVELLV